MKKHELLKTIDQKMLDKLFGFCYARTSGSYEAEELCSDIVFALCKAADAEGDIKNTYAFIWRVAYNVYSDFSVRRRVNAETSYEGDPEDILAGIVAHEATENDDIEKLRKIFRRIAFLSRAYREVMIAFYFDGKPVSLIAKEMKTSESAIRQRLFSARNTVRNEVNNMDTIKKPTSLEKMDFVIWGTGNPSWSDPRTDFCRQLSKHILYLCMKKPRTANEISEELNVPTLYVEDELDILVKGQYGRYGMLRRLDNGRYAVNIILLDKDQFAKAREIYTSRIPLICDITAKFIDEHKDEYLAFPYINRKVDLNLILWQQVSNMSYAFSRSVRSVLGEKYFPGIKAPDRPFSVFGYVDDGHYYGGGWDGIDAKNICGYSFVHVDNIYITRIKQHFHCGNNLANDAKLQLAIRAINGLDALSLSEYEKEQAAKAINEGYLFRDGNTLYTKFLVCEGKDSDRLFDITDRLRELYADEAGKAAAEMADFIKKNVPDYLIGEYRLANNIANLPVLDTIVESLTEKGLLVPPENRIGAEGVWMSVEK